MQRLTIFNGAQTPAAAIPGVDSTAAIRTMLQVQASRKFEVVEWGWSGDLFALAAPGAVELIDTGAIAATVTAHAASGINKTGDPDAEAVDTELRVTLGVSATGFTATAEGTVTAVRRFDQQYIMGLNQYVKQWPLGERPKMDHDTNLRIRNTFAAAVNVVCYVIINI